MLFNDSAFKLKLLVGVLRPFLPAFLSSCVLTLAILTGRSGFFQFFHCHAEIIQYVVLDKIFISILKHLIRQVHDPLQAQYSFHVVPSLP